MPRTRNRIKKMTFQTQDRNRVEISDFPARTYVMPVTEHDTD